MEEVKPPYLRFVKLSFDLMKRLFAYTKDTNEDCFPKSKNVEDFESQIDVLGLRPIEFDINNNA